MGGGVLGWGKNKQTIPNSFKGGRPEKKILCKEEMERKNSCRVNCTVWLKNCTCLKDTLTDTIFDLF